MREKNRNGLWVGLAVLAIAAGLGVPAAGAQGVSAMTAVSAEPQKPAVHTNTAQPATGPKIAQKSAKRYFIEFRARAAQSYGHAFAVYGRLNGAGKIATSTVAGLHPATESPVPWMIGHIVMVPSETGASDGDTEDQYITARYRILLSEPEYNKVVTHIKQMQASSPVWHAVFYNCNAFVGDIARFMGMQAPATLLFPADFINELRAMNSGGQNSGGQQAAAAGPLPTY